MWRTLDVGAVVESLPVVDAVVAAGVGGMAREITRARPAATAEQLRHVAAGELVVTTAATLLSTGEQPEHLIARLDAAHIAGLAVRLDLDEQLPSDVLAMADQVALPVITFPEAAALSDVTAAVLDALLDAQRQRLQHVLDIHQRFARIDVAGGGAPEVAATLHDLLERTVAVVDSDGRPIVIVPSDAAIDLDPNSTSTVRQPIVAGDQTYGAVVADPGEFGLDADGTVAMERAALGLAVRLAQASAVAEAQERFAALSLEELISAHGSASDVAERAGAFGWDLNRPRAVLLASIDPPEEGPIPPNALSTIAAAARATLGRDAIVWTRSATIAALVAPETDDPAERRHIAEGLRRELDQRLRSVNVSLGDGPRVEKPAMLPRG
jgi:purine catabolism regulator